MCWALKDGPPVTNCAWINLSYLWTCRSKLFWMQPLWTPTCLNSQSVFRSLQPVYSWLFCLKFTLSPLSLSQNWLKASLCTPGVLACRLPSREHLRTFPLLLTGTSNQVLVLIQETCIGIQALLSLSGCRWDRISMLVIHIRDCPHTAPFPEEQS